MKRNSVWLILICNAILALGGCSSTSKAPDAGSPSSENAGPPQEYPQPIGPQEVYGPEPVLMRPLTLVFGPGQARAFAYVGVIRALNEAKIPIGAIFGTEMGGLIGAIYAMDSNPNHFEWALARLRDDSFSEGSGLFGALRRKVAKAKIDSALGQIFGSKDLKDAMVPVHIALELQESKEVKVVDRGVAAQAVRAAISIPGQLSPGRWSDLSAVSASVSRPFLINEAKALGTGAVVVVYVSEKISAADEDNLKEADLVIRPDLAGIGSQDYSKRTETAFRGKNAVKEKLSELRHLVGLPENP